MTLQIGQMAPNFTLPSESGDTVTLSSFIGKSPVVLYFYPKDMTPGCTQESCDFRDAFPRFQQHGAVIFGISRDSVASHVKFKSTYHLPFSLLADEDGKVCEAFGVWKEKSMYGRKYMGIDRTTVVIAQDGTIQQIFEKVKVPGHVAEVEAVLTGAPVRAATPKAKAKTKAKSLGKKPAQKATKKVARKIAKKVATKATKKVVKKSAKKLAAKTIKKTAKKTLRAQPRAKKALKSRTRRASA